MSRPTPTSTRTLQRLWRKLGPGISMFAATLLALPVNAGITLPTDPLTTASRVPPNVLFILDDSGSMAFDYMPDSVPGTSNVSEVARRTYTRNTVFYNPNLTYEPWTTAGGAEMTGGTTWGSVYGSYNFASGTTINLGDSGSCAQYDYNGNGVDGNTNDTWVCGGVQTFYTPQDMTNTGATYLADGRNYYRYQITSASQVMRAEWGNVANQNNVTPGGFPRTNQSGTGAAWVNVWSFDVPVGTSNLTVSTTGGTETRNGVDLYLRPGGSPANSADGRLSSTNNNNVESISVTNPTAGTWYVGIYADRDGSNGTRSTFSGVTVNAVYTPTNRCDEGTANPTWINCVAATPPILNSAGQTVNRSAAAEAINYATWFSYHRTRIKAAKAGASGAFSGITSDMRVGFRTIWERNMSNPASNSPTFAVPIPVNSNGGLFLDTPDYNNRTRWYERLFATYASNGTPLHGALRKAGEYFSSNASNGPYGPGTGADQLACRQNFTILTTDGYWNSSSNYTQDVGNADGTAGSRITGPAGASYQYSPAAPYSDNYGTVNLGASVNDGTVDATLADVAMKYWKADLRTDLDNIVPTTTVNPAFWQHMVTFGIAIGLSGTVDQKSVAAVRERGNASVGGVNGWPQPRGDANTTIDDLLHASVNGRGTFVAANDPLAFANGLKSALAAITERTGSFSNVAANSAQLRTDSRLFHANYVSGVWTGEVLSYPRVTGSADFRDTADWRASEGIPTSGRKVYTSDNGVGADFPTTAQTTALARNGTNDEYRVTGANNAAYIKGDRSLELGRTGGTLRARTNLMGDIVSSSPFYASDTNTLYVGANDGMLHAINANTGAELFTYVPNGLNLSDLSTLSRPDYSHRYFVDGQIVVSSLAETPSGNTLIGTLGKGGKGLFALNVSAPSTVRATNVVAWEDLETPNNNMGLIQSRPVIVKLNNGDTGVIVPNGINSTNGRAVLLVYNISNGTLLAELDTGVGAAGVDVPNSNGLTGVAGWDADDNGTTDYVYGGDMLGNMWKFDLRNSAPRNWTVANSTTPMFVATGPDGTTRQPITGAPTVAMHPTSYKTWVFFGTGRFMTTGDVNSRAVQSLYAVIDGTTVATKSDLTQRTIAVVGTSGGRRVRGFEANASLPSGSRGWYINLVEPPYPPGTASGERIVSAPQMDGSALQVNSIIPTADACQSDGRGYQNALDAFTGTSTKVPYFDANNDGNLSNDTITLPDGTEVSEGSVDTNVGMVTTTNLMSGDGSGGLACAAGSSGTLECMKKNEMRVVGRVSWREVIRN